MKVFLVGLFAMMSLLTYSQNLDCSMYKDGTFSLVANGGTYIITRKGSKQTEEVVKTGEIVSFKVVWVNSCTYTLTPTSKTAKKTGLPKSAVVTVKITEVKKNSYMQTSTSSISDVVISAELIKIK